MGLRVINGYWVPNHLLFDLKKKFAKFYSNEKKVPRKLKMRITNLATFIKTFIN